MLDFINKKMKNEVIILFKLININKMEALLKECLIDVETRDKVIEKYRTLKEKCNFIIDNIDNNVNNLLQQDECHKDYNNLVISIKNIISVFNLIKITDIYLDNKEGIENALKRGNIFIVNIDNKIEKNINQDIFIFIVNDIIFLYYNEIVKKLFINGDDNRNIGYNFSIKNDFIMIKFFNYFDKNSYVDYIDYHIEKNATIPEVDLYLGTINRIKCIVDLLMVDDEYISYFVNFLYVQKPPIDKLMDKYVIELHKYLNGNEILEKKIYFYIYNFYHVFTINLKVCENVVSKTQHRILTRIMNGDIKFLIRYDKKL